MCCLRSSWAFFFFLFFQASENYILSSDTRSQLKFLEKLDQLEKQRKDLEEREMLLRVAKVRAYMIYDWTWPGKEVRIGFIVGWLFYFY